MRKKLNPAKTSVDLQQVIGLHSRNGRYVVIINSVELNILIGGRKMKKGHPLFSALLTLGYAVGGIVACWVLGIASVVVFRNQSDEAWNSVTWYLLTMTVFALPLGFILAIGSYFKAQSRSRPPENNARDVT